MKNTLKSLLLMSALSPFAVFAEVNVKLHKDVEAIVVQGEELPLTVMSKREFNLPDGQNQMVVRISKLVSNGSEFEKFRSDPLVISFDATNTTLEIKPSKDIRFEHQAKGFKSDPSIILLDEVENPLTVTQAVLPRGNGLTRDYERELEKFNQKQNTQFAKQTANQPTTAKMQSPENAMLLLKADFLRLSADEQKDFIQWAVKNI